MDINKFMIKFNFLFNIILIFILLFGSVIRADTNGVWTFASDIRGGTFGSDEQPISNFTFVNPVYFYNDMLSKNSSFFINISGRTQLDDLATKKVSANSADINGNAIIVGNVGVGTTNPTAKLDVNGDIKTNSGIVLGGVRRTNWPSSGISISYPYICFYTTYQYITVHPSYQRNVHTITGHYYMKRYPAVIRTITRHYGGQFSYLPKGFTLIGRNKWTLYSYSDGGNYCFKVVN